jgi:hypothetical protein
VLPAPELSRPFRDQDINEFDLYRETARLALARGVHVVPLSDVLRDADYRALRHDACCHYNVEGHALVARRLLDRSPLGALLRSAPRPANEPTTHQPTAIEP